MNQKLSTLLKVNADGKLISLLPPHKAIEVIGICQPHPLQAPEIIVSLLKPIEK